MEEKEQVSQESTNKIQDAVETTNDAVKSTESEAATAEDAKISAPKEEETNIEEQSKKTEDQPTSTDEQEAIEEIDESNAEDAEDSENTARHSIPFLDYQSMSMENLVGEMQRLLRTEKIQAIAKHFSQIKEEFDRKFVEFVELKKEEFVANGGNEIDFKYNSVSKRQFNEVYKDYREKRNQYYKQLEDTLKNNLEKRLSIIEELKGLIKVEEDINTTYRTFKEIQGKWRSAGPIPRTNYNDVWRTYHHHMEIFYDFLHLNRELRDLDFKHNLEEKNKLVARAEALAQEPSLKKAFRTLQTLHKIWKEEIGPVAKEHREEVWERFSSATKVMHAKRQEHYQELEKNYETNLEKKQELIGQINALADGASNTHKELQNQIKELEALRQQFFKAGKVPQKQNEATWQSFKEAVRKFNSSKNNFYKSQKKEQLDNLNLKRALLDRAIALKDNEVNDSATNEVKKIQADWKKIGHVPRKYSDKIWKEFKGACNGYFDRLNNERNEAQKADFENYEKKAACLEKIKAFEMSGDNAEDLKSIKGFIADWKSYGRVPHAKKHINAKFNKVLDALFKKLGISQQESELLKYGDKIQQLVKKEDSAKAIGNERFFIRKKIEESNSEIRQLENNLQFFSNASESNPLVKDVIKNIERHKKSLETWKAKLKKLNIMENNLNKEVVAQDTGSEEE